MRALIRRPLWLVAAVLIGGVIYLLSLGFCMGTEPGTGSGQSCALISPVLKFPFLFALPYAETKYFGVYSAAILVALNALFWGALLSLGLIVARALLKHREME